MTSIRSVALFAFLLATPCLRAQDVPAPAAELAKLKPLAGHWQGSGTATMEPGQPPAKWTAAVKAEWVLGGHWLMSDTAVDFATGEKMRFLEYFGWDRENRHYVSVAVNNMGEVVLSRPHLLGDDTMVVMTSNLRQGTPEVERAVTKFGADAQSFTITFFGARGPAADGVTGKLERTTKAEPPPIESAAALMPVRPEMAKLARMTGRFDVAGEMTMMPGAPAIKIKGTDEVRTLFGGGVVQVATTGTAEGMSGTYQAHGYYAWDAEHDCYAMLMVSSMGEVMNGACRFAGDDKLIQTFAGLHMGQAFVARTVMDLDESGKPVKAVNHSCAGTAEPMRDFIATYRPAAK